MRKYLGSLSLALALTLAGVLIVPVAPASATVYVQLPPPPVQFEVRGAPPSQAHAWIGGYHRWDGREYGWVPGRWQRPPYPYATWVPGHWRHRAYGWYWVPGHWRG